MSKEQTDAMTEAIHYWFCAVEFYFKEHDTYTTVTLPHLVGFAPDPNDEETKTIPYQQAEVEENVKAVMSRSKLEGLTYTINPTGKTEFPGKPWFRFNVVISIPK